MRTRAIYLLLATLAGCQRVELQEFSPDGSFRVLLPEEKKEMSQDFAGATGKVWLSEFNDGALFVGVAELPVRKLSETEADRLLQASVQQNIKESKAELVNESEIKLGEYPGRQFEAKVKVPRQSGGGELDGVIKRRVYLADGKLFILGALGRHDWVNSPQIQRFLDSLQLSK
jgi:hypothetical protein